MSRFRNNLKEVYAIWIGERPSQMAAALAYYAMFSFAPVVYIAFTIAGIFIDQVAVADRYYAQLQIVVGADLAGQIRNMVELIAEADTSGTFLVSLVSFLALFYAASGLFFQLQYALNVVWRVPPPQKGQTLTFVRKRALSFVMVVGVALLLIAATLANLIVAWFGGVLESLLGLGISTSFWAGSVTVTLIALSCALLYKLLPDVRIAWRDVVLGSIAAALLILLATMVAALFFRSGGVGSAFEAAGAIAVFLIVVNTVAQIFLLGAVITRVVSKSRVNQDSQGPVPAGEVTKQPEKQEDQK